jgi:flagellar biogenesis protein FliO
MHTSYRLVPDLIFLLAFLGILVLFIRRFSRKRRSSGKKIFRNNPVKRKEIRKVNERAVIDEEKMNETRN